ncbi:helix-turn-helix domain-containing protein [Elusimicrobiota bacterium]
MNKRFNLLLEQALKKNKMSLRELARKTGLDVSFFSKMLSGKRNPPSNEGVIAKIAHLLQVKPEKLIIAAGKVPSNLEEILNREEVIESLLSNKTGDFAVKKTSTTISRKISKKDEEKRAVLRVPEIEDELL